MRIPDADGREVHERGEADGRYFGFRCPENRNFSIVVPSPTSPTGGFWRGEAFGIARARVQRSALQGVSVQATGRRGGAVIFGGGWAGRFFWGGRGGEGRASGVAAGVGGRFPARYGGPGRPCGRPS